MADLNRSDIFDPKLIQAPLDFAKNMGVAVDQLNAFIKSGREISQNVAGANSIKKLNEETKNLTASEVELIKIQKQIETAQARNNEEYAKQVKILQDVKQAQKESTQLSAAEAKQITAKTASLQKLDQALKKNREEYSKLTSEEQRNSKSGKDLLRVIQDQDKASKQLSTSLGQQQKKVGGYADEIGTLSPKVGGLVTQVQGLAKAFFSLLANPVVLFLTAIAGIFLACGKAISIFTSETLEGEEKLNVFKSSLVGVREALNDVMKDFGEALIDNPMAAFSELAATMFDHPLESFKRFQEEVKKKQVIAKELAQLENQIAKDRIRDVVDDARTEVEVTALIEKVKSKTLFTDKERLGFLLQANKKLSDQLDGDLILAQKEVEIIEEKIKLGGGVIQNNKLLANYTDAEFFALRANKELIGELGRAQEKLLKTESDATQKRTALKKQYNALVEEIAKAERDAQNRVVDAELNAIKVGFEAQVKANEAIIKDENSTGDQIVQAILTRNSARINALTAGHELELEQLRRAAEDRIRAEGEYNQEVINQRLKADMAYQDAVKTSEFKHQKETEETFAASSARITSTIKQQAANSLKELNEEFSKGNIPLSEYYAKKKEITEQGEQDSFDILVEFAIKQKDLLKSLGVDTSELEREIQLMQQSDAQSHADKMIAIKQKEHDLTLQLTDQIFASTSQISAGFTAKEDERLSAELERLKAYYDEQIFLAGDNEMKKDLLKQEQARKEKEVEAERRKNQRKQVIIQKGVDAAKIIANTAVGISAQLPGLPFTAGLIALITSIGALQLATVLATPIPAFELGTKSAPGGLALVGEGGTELMRMPGGGIKFTPNKPTLMDIPKGTEIIPNPETMKMLALSGFASSVNGGTQDERLLEKVDQLNHSIKNIRIPRTEIVRSAGTVYEAMKDNDNRTQYIRRMAMGKWI